MNDDEYRQWLSKHDDWLPSFGCWDLAHGDEKGREMVYLDVEVDNGCDGCLEEGAGKSESDVENEYKEGRCWLHTTVSKSRAPRD